MEKIYFLQEEVWLGQTIKINGLNVTVDKHLIENNPDRFLIKGDEYPEYIKVKEGAWCIYKMSKSTDFVGKILKVIGMSPKHYEYGLYFCENGFACYVDYAVPATKEDYDRQNNK
jgi:hypothetical protein